MIAHRSHGFILCLADIAENAERDLKVSIPHTDLTDLTDF